MRKVLAFACLIALSVCALPSALWAQESPADIIAEEDIIGRMTVPVMVNGRGPFRFIVDTGANRSALARGVVDQLHLPSAGFGEVHAFTGVFTAPLARVETLRSGAVDIRSGSLPVIDSAMLAGADGLLGMEAMEDHRLIMDFRNRRVTVERANVALRGRSWQDVPAQRSFGNLIQTEGRIGRVRVNMIIDTGANFSFANTALRDSLRSSRARAQAITGSRLLSAGSRTVVLDEAVFIPVIKLERTDVRNVRAYVGDLYIFSLWGLMETPTIVIGMDLLSQLEAVAVDYRRSMIHLRSRPTPPRLSVLH
jgi:predicted aspartyl protease